MKEEIDALLPNVISNRFIYNFFSNRSLLQFPRYVSTIAADLINEYSININDIRLSMCLMYYYNRKFIEEIDGDVDRNSADIFIKHMETVLYKSSSDTTTMELKAQYHQYNNIDSGAHKNLYCCNYDNYIYSFISIHKEYIQQSLYTLLLSTIPSMTYCSKNAYIDNYIKKFIVINLLKYLYGDVVIEYYNLCRFMYLYTHVNNMGAIPILYSNQNGVLYFDVSYNKKHKKEQIIERIYSNTDSFGKIDVNEVFFHIHYSNNEYKDCAGGSITKYRSLYSSNITVSNGIRKYRTVKIHDTFPMNDYCNVSRKILHSMIKVKDYKSQLGSLYTLWRDRIAKNRAPIEYACLYKQEAQYSMYRLPLRNCSNGADICADSEIHKYSFKDLDISNVIDKYHKILSNTINTLLSIG